MPSGEGLTPRQLGGAIALGMVDMFALAVSHGLLALAVWRLLSRDDLYDDPGREPRRPMRRGGNPPDA